MKSRIIRHGFKDVLFKDIFSRKEYLLQLVNALNNSSYTNPDDLEITTIEGIIYATLKNDVSFLLGSEMHLWEQQSTYNPNMPLRGLMYFAELYQEYLSTKDVNLYGSTVIKIPTPKFVVFYNGVQKMPETMKLRLSDAFISPDKDKEFEWTATMLNINETNNRNLKNKCLALLEYSDFVDIIKRERKNKVPIGAAVEKALDHATKQKCLDDYFNSCKEEVMNMSLTEFDQESFERQIRAEGVTIGMAQGKEEAKLETARKMIQEKLPKELVLKITGINNETYTALLEEVAQFN